MPGVTSDRQGMGKTVQNCIEKQTVMLWSLAIEASWNCSGNSQAGSVSVKAVPAQAALCRGGSV